MNDDAIGTPAEIETQPTKLPLMALILASVDEPSFRGGAIHGRTSDVASGTIPQIDIAAVYDIRVGTIMPKRGQHHAVSRPGI